MITRLLACGWLLLAATALTAQAADTADIRQRLDEYTALTARMDVDGILAYIDPKLFELVPKEMLAAQFEQIFADTNMHVGFNDFAVGSIGEIYQLEDTDYALVSYELNMFMEMRSAAYRDTSFMAMMVGMLAGKYGPDRVKSDPATYRIDVRSPKIMIAIRRPGLDEFYFIDYDPNSAQMLETLVPRAVQERIGLN